MSQSTERKPHPTIPGRDDRGRLMPGHRYVPNPIRTRRRPNYNDISSLMRKHDFDPLEFSIALVKNDTALIEEMCGGEYPFTITIGGSEDKPPKKIKTGIGPKLAVQLLKEMIQYRYPKLKQIEVSLEDVGQQAGIDVASLTREDREVLRQLLLKSQSHHDIVDAEIIEGHSVDLDEDDDLLK